VKTENSLLQIGRYNVK